MRKYVTGWAKVTEEDSDTGGGDIAHACIMKERGKTPRSTA